MPGNASDARAEPGAHSVRSVIGLPRHLLPALVASLTVVGCGGGSGDRGPSGVSAATPGPSSARATEGTGVTFPLATAPAPPATTTTTVPPEGLPEHHPVPANGIVTLGGDSTWAQSVTVRGVPIAEVHDWFVGGVIGGGYAIVDDQPNHVEFSGDGVFGVADLSKHDGTVEIAFVLGSPQR